MQKEKPIKCPNCNKTIIYYVDGYATFKLKCNNNKCKNIIKIYSAGKTAIFSENKDKN